MPKLRSISEKTWSKVSLTTLLTGLASLSVLLTSTILLTASYQSKKQSLMDTTLSLNLSNANKMSHTVDSLFISMRNSLKYSASLFMAIDDMGEDEIDRKLELMRNSSNYFNSIILVNEKGLVSNVSPQAVGTKGKFISGKAALEALAAKESYVSEPYTTSSTGRLIVFMSEPLFDKHGVYRGVIGGTIYLQQNNVLHMIFGDTARDDDGSYFYMVGSDGHLLYHPDQERLGEDVTANKVVQKLIQGRSGQEQVVNTKGVRLLAGYSTVPANGWGVVVVSPFSVMYEQLIRHIMTMLLYTLLPFAVLMVAVVLLARGLAKPFVSLADLVSHIGTDKFELPERKQHWNREADLLTEAISLALTDLKRQTDQLTLDAITDPLTGLLNRRTFESIMHEWTQEGTPFSIIVLDIDRFKAINDTYGHQAGDEVLKYIADTVSSSVRLQDVCCRYGGEEFVLLLHLCSAQEAHMVAEGIRASLMKSTSPVSKPITVSLGIAQYPLHSPSPDELFRLADQALYKAKETGRNRAVIADTVVAQRKL
ncbi:sensor domain-containing diguanylate cyclase [Paenibacillus oenotherae]|uniref:Sensor domain-containing diguanylate cyclase n=1 Tax=Paenibacillus oenotherae TaxID=1435645 RepID=A0ABS7DC37_9BACL|nr:sensor domain-containing diguanylate cyclase [Paenibacillus oenotherae]MBW7477057.1 sensor domain-containing diguanylate cyclase [Paenibacillus oenotherae]